MALTRGRLIKGGLGAAAVLALGAGAAAAQTPPVAGRGPFGMGRGLGPGMAAGAGVGMGFGGASDALLERLGLTAEQLYAERRAGKSLAQIAQAKGVDRAALITLLYDEHKARLAEVVKAGRLTQEQADAMLAVMKTRIETEVDDTTIGPPSWAGPQNGGFGIGRMGGMMGRGRSFGPPAASGQPTQPGSPFGPGYGPPWARQS